MSAVLQTATFGTVVPVMKVRVYMPATPVVVHQAVEDPEGLVPMLKGVAAGFGWGFGWFGLFMAFALL